MVKAVTVPEHLSLVLCQVVSWVRVAAGSADRVTVSAFLLHCYADLPGLKLQELTQLSSGDGIPFSGGQVLMTPAAPHPSRPVLLSSPSAAPLPAGSDPGSAAATASDIPGGSALLLLSWVCPSCLVCLMCLL